VEVYRFIGWVGESISLFSTYVEGGRNLLASKRPEEFWNYGNKVKEREKHKLVL
jgi:hypothetical protein